MQEDQLRDELLIEAIAGKAMWGLERLHEHYSGQLYRVAYRMTTDHMMAEELVQDTFFAVWQRAPSYTPQMGLVRTWLFSILYHRTIDYLRTAHRRSCVQQVSWTEVEANECDSTDIWQHVWNRVQNRELHRCLSLLTAEQQTVIELAYFDECTHLEIAQRCHIPLGTVKARIRLGILHLRQMLERGGDENTSLSCKSKAQIGASPVVSVVVQVRENECITGYELCQDSVCSCFRYSEWELLLDHLETFEFRGNAGCFIAQKEGRKHSFWYAYPCGGRRGNTVQHKSYLGRSATLTLARLEAMAKTLHETEPAAPFFS